MPWFELDVFWPTHHFVTHEHIGSRKRSMLVRCLINTQWPVIAQTTLVICFYKKSLLLNLIPPVPILTFLKFNFAVLWCDAVSVVNLIPRFTDTSWYRKSNCKFSALQPCIAVLYELVRNLHPNEIILLDFEWMPRIQKILSTRNRFITLKRV